MSNYDEALGHKRTRQAEMVAFVAKRWYHVNVANAAAAVNFINAPPAQGPGEASFTNNANGSVDVYFYM